MKTFIIRDWAGNQPWPGVTFEDFEDAWGYIRQQHEGITDEQAYDEALNEYSVEEV